MKHHDKFQDLATSVVETFFQFHAENPHIYTLFEKYALEMRRAGRVRYSAQTIIERIRWHVNVETRGDDFKLNNNHVSCYARLLMIQQPSFESFFQLRSSQGVLFA